MFDLRDMQLLTALARHGHFARAAEASGISQPAFSARIRNLERELGAPLVKRGNRFQGLTEEGSIALRWAHRMLADANGLMQDVSTAKGALAGRLAIGVVPTALTFVAQAPAPLREAHPALQVEIVSASSTDLRKQLEDDRIDVAITYLSAGAPPGYRVEALYEERYVLVAPPHIAPRLAGEATWTEAATLPLCLLTRDMRNRQIIDEVFASLNLAPKPRLQTNAFSVALAQVLEGGLAMIAAAQAADRLPVDETRLVRLPLVEPDISRPIGLVMLDRDPPQPAALAAAQVIRGLVG